MTLADDRPLALFAVLAVLACHDGTAPTPATTPRELDAVGNLAQFAVRGDDAPEPLRVRVIGSDGKPFPGARVAWTTAQGVAVLDPATSTTDAAGEATTRVDELAVLGQISVTASVANVPSVSFTVNVADPCLTVDAHPTRIDSVVTGTLRVIDCRIADRYFDFYAFVLTTQRAVTLRATSSSFSPWVHATDLATGYGLGSFGNDAGGGSIAMRIILPAGVNGMAVTSMDPLQTGGYTLTAEPADEDVRGCGWILVAHNIDTHQQLEAGDCAASSGDPYFDVFQIYLWAGQSVTLSESSTAFTPRLRVFSSGGTMIEDATGDGANPARIDLTSRVGDYYAILASSVTTATGTYALSVAEGSTNLPQLTARRDAAATREWRPAPRAQH